jgi:prefoldin subunit 5
MSLTPKTIARRITGIEKRIAKLRAEVEVLGRLKADLETAEQKAREQLGAHELGGIN